MLAEQAIKTLDHECWILVDTDGKPHENGDGEPHYESKDKAEEAYAGLYRRYTDVTLPEKAPLLVPVKLDEPCLTITAACGYVLDEEADGVCHNDDAHILLSYALGSGWSILPDSRMVCADPSLCAECRALLDALPPDQGPISGQLTIDGGEVVKDCELPALGPLSPDAQINLGELRRLDQGGDTRA